jgi:hypothetical protein
MKQGLASQTLIGVIQRGQNMTENVTCKQTRNKYDTGTIPVRAATRREDDPCL